MSPNITLIKNAAHDTAEPILSVLIPYFRDNPAELLEQLIIDSTGLNFVEICLYDDGTANTEINTALIDIAKSAPLPVTLLFAENNTGRSSARNHLTTNARAGFVLFLDADMRPDSPHFLKTYLDIIKNDTADIIFGGFTVASRADTPDQEVHRALSEISDCLPLEHRIATGPQHVATSNLCVRKSVLEAEDFDSNFKGWGWEDSEWAARVAKKYRLLHIENPALHLGLENTDTLLDRFKNSAQNYLRFTTRHPELARSLKLYSVSKTLGRIPGQRFMRPVLKFTVKTQHIPMRFRLTALRLWRASWYAEALS